MHGTKSLIPFYYNTPMKSNPWDNLSPIFAGDTNLQDIPPEAADNILIAWPVLIDFINHNDPQPRAIYEAPAYRNIIEPKSIIGYFSP